jgi:hypothetical protein
MGAINETALKMGSYQTPMIHMIFPQLVRLLEERRQCAVESSHQGDRSATYVEYVERVNKMIMETLSIPVPEKKTDNSKEFKEQIILLQENRRKMMHTISDNRSTLEAIIERLKVDEGNNITPDMVQKLYQDIANLAAEALK